MLFSSYGIHFLKKHFQWLKNLENKLRKFKNWRLRKLKSFSFPKVETNKMFVLGSSKREELQQEISQLPDDSMLDKVSRILCSKFEILNLDRYLHMCFLRTSSPMKKLEFKPAQPMETRSVPTRVLCTFLSAVIKEAEAIWTYPRPSAPWTAFVRRVAAEVVRYQ